jgi:hypothetical protein
MDFIIGFNMATAPREFLLHRHITASLVILHILFGQRRTKAGERREMRWPLRSAFLLAGFEASWFDTKPFWQSGMSRVNEPAPGQMAQCPGSPETETVDMASERLWNLLMKGNPRMHFVA